MRERLGVALAVGGTLAGAARARISWRDTGALLAGAIALVAVFVLFVLAVNAVGRTSPASPCWQEPTRQAVQACFAREQAP